MGLRIGRTIAQLTFAIAAVACGSDTAPRPTTTTVFFCATFSNPNATVRANGQVISQITQQHTGPADCASLSKAPRGNTLLAFTATIGQHYSFTWDYGNSTSGVAQIEVTQDVIDSPCFVETINQPPQSDRRP